MYLLFISSLDCTQLFIYQLTNYTKQYFINEVRFVTIKYCIYEIYDINPTLNAYSSHYLNDGKVEKESNPFKYHSIFSQNSLSLSLSNREINFILIMPKHGDKHEDEERIPYPPEEENKSQPNLLRDIRLKRGPSPAKRLFFSRREIPWQVTRRESNTSS